jgi:hypothetical protein
MTTKVIKRGDPSFRLESARPDYWPHDTTVTVDVFDLNGNQLEADLPVSTYSGDTLAVGARKGEYSITLATGNAVNSGEVIQLTNELEGHQVVKAISFEMGTQELLFEPGLEYDFSSGTTVAGTEMSCVIDASNESYDNIQTVSVLWKPADDNLAMPQTWRVLSREHQLEGLELAFKTQFSSVYDRVGSGGVSMLYRTAEEIIRQKLEIGGKDMKLIVDNEILRQAIMEKMALISGTGGDLGEDQYTRIKENFDSHMDMIENLGIWEDSDEDSTLDEGEKEKMQQIPVARGI